MNLLPVIPRIHSNLSGERYLGYQLFENMKCKYSNYDKLNEISRFSNGSNQFNNFDKYQVIRNSRYYEGDLMQVVIEPNKFNESGRIFNRSTKNGREFNSSRLLNNTQNDVKSITKPLMKRNYDASLDEFNIKRSQRDEISNKFNEISEKESYGSSKETQNDEKKADIIDEDDLTDYFIGTETMCSKSYAEPVSIETCLPTKLSEDDIRIERESLSSKYDIFDYAHKSVDVEKLPIVDPNFNTKRSKECCVVQSNLVKSCSETPKKLTCSNGSVANNNNSVVAETSTVLTPKKLTCSNGSVANNNNSVVAVTSTVLTSKKLTCSNGSVANNNNRVVAVTSTVLTNINDEIRKVDNKSWKLILIDCPLRVQVSSGDVNLKNCSIRDPRLNHLRP